MTSDIQIQNLNFSYANEVTLENINLSYNKKDFLAIVGPNGGGKTTLIKLILNLLQPQSGFIRIFNEQNTKNIQKISYVPQKTDININLPIKIIDLVLMGRLGISSKFGFYSKNDKIQALNALKEVNILHLKDKKVSELSGGELQRALISRALCGEAEIMILDEPTSNVDPTNQIEIYKLLKKLNKDMGIIIISHDTNILLGYANKVAYINKKLYMHDTIDIPQNHKHQDHICPVELLHIGCDHD